MTLDTIHSISDPCYNARLVNLPERPGAAQEEEIPDMFVTYCTPLAVESKLKKTNIPENVILGGIRDMKNDDDAVLEEAAADTTAKQNTQQPTNGRFWSQLINVVSLL